MWSACFSYMDLDGLRGSGFKPRYRQIHSGSDDHLKWRTSVIGSYPQWQAKEPQGR